MDWVVKAGPETGQTGEAAAVITFFLNLKGENTTLSSLFLFLFFKAGHLMIACAEM